MLLLFWNDSDGITTQAGAEYRASFDGGLQSEYAAVYVDGQVRYTSTDDQRTAVEYVTREPR